MYDCRKFIRWLWPFSCDTVLVISQKWDTSNCGEEEQEASILSTALSLICEIQAWLPDEDFATIVEEKVGCLLHIYHLFFCSKKNEILIIYMYIMGSIINRRTSRVAFVCLTANARDFRLGLESTQAVYRVP